MSGQILRFIWMQKVKNSIIINQFYQRSSWPWWSVGTLSSFLKDERGVRACSLWRTDEVRYTITEFSDEEKSTPEQSERVEEWHELWWVMIQREIENWEWHYHEAYLCEEPTRWDTRSLSWVMRRRAHLMKWRKTRRMSNDERDWRDEWNRSHLSDRSEWRNDTSCGEWWFKERLKTENEGKEITTGGNRGK
jgi:hypothetical protein